MTEPYARRIDETLQALDVDAELGLGDEAVRRRLREHGRNQLSEARRASPWAILVAQFKSLVIGILAAAAVLSFAMGDLVQGLAILAAIVFNTVIGFTTEWKAVRSMEALRQLGTLASRVRRAGESAVVSAEELVPGDIVLIEGGDVIAADLRLIEANNLTCDESALTGESVPVTKTTDAVAPDTPLAERSSMAFKGTAVTSGSGAGVVVATGMDTAVGEIARMAEVAEEEVTPLERRLDRLGQRLVVLTLIIAVVIAGVGWMAGKDLVAMIATAIALAVAAVPEGLPIVATVALARGMWRMAQRNALVERLTAVETLGSTNVIFTDKTGTLTENRMTVARLAVPGTERDIEWGSDRAPDDLPDVARRLLEVGVLCNNAALGGKEDAGDGETAAEDTAPDKGLPERISSGTGDPLEVALLAAGAVADIQRGRLLERQPEQREVSFDSETKMMATFHQIEDGYRVAVKGAPEAVLSASSHVATGNGKVEALSDEDRRSWRERMNGLAKDGLRVLAFAERTVDTSETEPYRELTLLGLAGLADPAREDVPEAVRRCRDAGIRVVMVTGDQPVTAAAIAEQVGLAEANAQPVSGSDLPDFDSISDEERASLREHRVFARVSPRQKLDLIRLWQEAGAVVAMTGDGVNDAPALKKADVGVAMGQRGTDVAREAADIVLKDDAFPTIVMAIEQGRKIFENIRRFIIFLLSGNLGEILAIGVCASIGAPLPLLPMQILYINLVLDVFPALALGVGEGSAGIMRRAPRERSEPVLTRRHWIATVLWGSLIATTATGVFFVALGPLGMGTDQAVTIAFLTFALARLWHVFNMRDPGSGLLDNDVVRNRWVWYAIALCLLLLGAAAWLPGLAAILGVVALDPTGWALVIGGSLVPIVVGQAVLAFNPGAARSESENPAARQS